MGLGDTSAIIHRILTSCVQMTLMELLGVDRQQREARSELEALRTETRAAQVACRQMKNMRG